MKPSVEIALEAIDFYFEKYGLCLPSLEKWEKQLLKTDLKQMVITFYNKENDTITGTTTP